MARASLVFLLVLSPALVLAELPDTLWSANGLPLNAVLYDAAGLVDGTYLVAGSPSLLLDRNGALIETYDTGCSTTSCFLYMGSSIFAVGWTANYMCIDGNL